MLVVKGLSFGYRARRLISNLSFELNPGEILHVIGPNGTGKSTLLQLLAGLIAAESGSIKWDKPESIEYLPAEANGLYLAMSARENLNFWLSLRDRRLNSNQIDECLKTWNLAQPWLALGLPVARFSTGMKRRLALVRLTLAGAPCWLLDEPVYGLDEEAILEFRQALKHHVANGGSAVIVSHDLSALDAIPHSKLSLGSHR